MSTVVVLADGGPGGESVSAASVSAANGAPAPKASRSAAAAAGSGAKEAAAATSAATTTTSTAAGSASAATATGGYDTLPERHLMIVLCALCTCINYADRVNMSVAIISLSEQFGLDTRAQSLVLSSFFLGYIPMNIGGALLCRRHGGKAVLQHGAIAWSVCTLLTPAAARAGLPALLGMRVAMGLAEGVAFPAIFHFTALWVPPAERARAIGIFLTGVHVGTTVALVASPLIIAAAGWPAVFHVFGLAVFFGVAGWPVLARDRDALPARAGPPGASLWTRLRAPPASPKAAEPRVVRSRDDVVAIGSSTATKTPAVAHTAAPRSPPDPASDDGADTEPDPLVGATGMSDTEIVSGAVSVAVGGGGSLGNGQNGNNGAGGAGGCGGWLFGGGLNRAETRLLRVILTDRRMVAVSVSQCLYGLVHFTILSWLPTYFKEVYGGSTQQLALTCVPYATMIVSVNVGGWLGDSLLRAGVSARRARKLVTVVACVGAGTMLIVFSRRETVGGALAAISAAMAFKSLNSGGFEAAFFDIARPAETGLFKGVANTLSSVSGFVAVPLSAVVLDLVGGSWRKMFASLAIWYVLMGTAFCVLYTGERVSSEEEDR